MAMSVPANSAEGPMGEMNTTPLIDVMLCLLIMMMLSIPLQTHAVKIDLPAAGPGGDIFQRNKIIIAANGAVLWNGTAVTQVQLAHLLDQTRSITPSPELQLEPDRQARYVIVDQTLATIKRSGVGGLGFVGNERYGRDF
jgi:biopolymer transport protein ExbD